MTQSAFNAEIDAILSRRRIIVTCGTGGVGKTTLSSALALRAALLGKSAVVITVDPAKRLVSSLGLHESGMELGDRPTDLTPLLREAIQKKKPELDFKGSFHAIVPNTRETFEALLRRMAPTEALAQKVLKNPIFQIFTKEFSGANEYMALERLLALDREKQFDCIILDTPPSRSTLEFLDAPQLLGQLFEESMLKWLVLPANRFLAGGMRKALGILENLTGAGFMTDLLDFAAALFEVRAKFVSNLGNITELLRSEGVGFLMVTTPMSGSPAEVRHFTVTLKERGFRFDGLALNHTLGALKLPESPPARPELAHSVKIIEALQSRERAATQDIPVCARLPELARDVHSVEDLLHVALAFDTPRT